MKKHMTSFFKKQKIKNTIITLSYAAYLNSTIFKIQSWSTNNFQNIFFLKKRKIQHYEIIHV